MSHHEYVRYGLRLGVGCEDNAISYSNYAYVCVYIYIYIYVWYGLRLFRLGVGRLGSMNTLRASTPA